MTKMPAKQLRRKRGAKIRLRHAALGSFRIVARLSGRHTYAQIISPDNNVLAASGTPQKALRESLDGKYSNIAAAETVGRNLAEQAAGLDLGRLAFDRGGRKYHGRIRALAESLRAGGLKF